MILIPLVISVQSGHAIAPERTALLLEREAQVVHSQLANTVYQGYRMRPAPGKQQFLDSKPKWFGVPDQGGILYAIPRVRLTPPPKTSHGPMWAEPFKITPQNRNGFKVIPITPDRSKPLGHLISGH